MIGLNYLGKMGQLGNQMFQYAALKGIARNRGLEYMIPNHNDAIKDALGIRLNDLPMKPSVILKALSKK